jgi:hypothetical protein
MSKTKNTLFQKLRTDAVLDSYKGFKTNRSAITLKLVIFFITILIFTFFFYFHFNNNTREEIELGNEAGFI